MSAELAQRIRDMTMNKIYSRFAIPMLLKAVVSVIYVFIYSLAERGMHYLRQASSRVQKNTTGNKP